MVTCMLPGEKWSWHHKTLLPVDHFIFCDKMLPKNNNDVARLSMPLDVQCCHCRNITTNATGWLFQNCFWCDNVARSSMLLEVGCCYCRNTTTSAAGWLFHNCFWHVEGPPPEKHSPIGTGWFFIFLCSVEWCQNTTNKHFHQCHQLIVSPFFSTKVNGTKVGHVALLSMCNAITNAAARSAMKKFIAYSVITFPCGTVT